MTKVVSLYSGCGGLDLGFIWEGYEMIWANDNHEDAALTYKKNIGADIVCESIEDVKLADIPNCDIIIGGPPCQSFSLVGKRDPKDPRGNLVWLYRDVIKSKRPRLFLMENVIGLRAAKDKTGNKVLPQLCSIFTSLGYTVNTFILNAADYGVPQRRKRLFIVGHKGGMKIPPPPPTHAEDVSPNPTLKAWVSAEEAIGDLSTPDENSDLGHYIKPPSCEYQQFSRGKNRNKYGNHTMPYMSETDIKIIKSVPPGGNYMNVPDNIATTRIKTFKKTGGRTTTYGRLDPSKPSYTLNTHFSRPNVGCNIHYGEDRLITIREGLRLQSFLDGFAVMHSSKRSAYIQVGNAVPPLLAQAIAKHLLNYF